MFGLETPMVKLASVLVAVLFILGGITATIIRIDNLKKDLALVNQKLITCETTGDALRASIAEQNSAVENLSKTKHDIEIELGKKIIALNDKKTDSNRKLQFDIKGIEASGSMNCNDAVNYILQRNTSWKLK